MALIVCVMPQCQTSAGCICERQLRPVRVAPQFPHAEQHVSGEGGPTVGWLWHVDAEHSVWCGEISRALFDEASSETRDAMGNDYGWFLVLYSKTKKIILGKTPDEYLGRDLAETIALGLIANPKMIATLLQDAT